MYHSFIAALLSRISLIHLSQFSFHLRRMQYLTGFSKQQKQKKSPVEWRGAGVLATLCSRACGVIRAPLATGARGPRKHLCSKSTSLNVFWSRGIQNFTIDQAAGIRGRLIVWLGAAGSKSQPENPVFKFLLMSPNPPPHLFLPTTRKIKTPTCDTTVFSQKQSYNRSKKSFLQSAPLFFFVDTCNLKKKKKIHHIYEHTHTRSPMCVQSNSKTGAQTLFFEFLHTRTHTHTLTLSD